MLIYYICQEEWSGKSEQFFYTFKDQIVEAKYIQPGREKKYQKGTFT